MPTGTTLMPIYQAGSDQVVGPGHSEQWCTHVNTDLKGKYEHTSLKMLLKLSADVNPRKQEGCSKQTSSLQGVPELIATARAVGKVQKYIFIGWHYLPS